ncbi:hypothetical protein L6452_41129 [Arctium lappa]|uniref:Uncharacterized protein n=1 Tax=Arctium lappa TaxID=4217 RepID=A0ACB8XP04_ARCLA|nr:hypothetical protein L6452_41129 [Arctium lappa]
MLLEKKEGFYWFAWDMQHLAGCKIDTKSDKIEETPGGTKYYVPTVDELLVPKVGDRHDRSFNNVSTPVKDQNQCEAECEEGGDCSGRDDFSGGLDDELVGQSSVLSSKRKEVCFGL